MNKHFSKLRLSLTGIGALLLMVLVFSACNKSDDLPATPAAGLMVFNLAPDQGAVGFALSGNQLTNAPLGYTNYNGGYQSIFTGSRTTEVFKYGSGSIITSNPFNYEADKYYSSFLVGANGTYSNIITRDNIDSLTSPDGRAYIRYINAIPDSSSPLVTITANGSTVINTSAAYTNISEFTEVAPGSVVITVNNNSNIQVNRTITLEQRKIYTVLLSGIPGSADTDKAVQIKFIENGTISEKVTGQ